jgi:hypothetical protein
MFSDARAASPNLESTTETIPNLQMGAELPGMKRTRTQLLNLVAVLLCACLSCPVVVLAEGADEIRKANEDLAKQGWVVDSLHVEGTDQPGLRHLFARGRVRIPAEAAWQAMANENDEDWPGLKNVVREYENGDTLISRYKLGVPVYADRTYRLRIINDHPKWTMNFQQIHGYGNVREIHGYWSISATSDTLSQVVYCLYTDPGAKWIPGFIVNWATKREIPHLFEHLYQSGKTYVGKTARKTGLPDKRSANLTDDERR